MGGNQSTTQHIANDTDENLEVSVEYLSFGMPMIYEIPAHGSFEIPTSGRFLPTVSLCVTLRSGHPAWISRTLFNSSGVLIRKRGPYFALYITKSNDLWTIDTKDELNKAIGF